VTIIAKLPSTSAVTDDGTKLSDSLIDQNMIESHMMEPVDGNEAIHFDRANGDDLADNQDLANDRCVYVCVEVIWLLYVVYFVCIWVHSFDFVCSDQMDSDSVSSKDSSSREVSPNAPSDK